MTATAFVNITGVQFPADLLTYTFVSPSQSLVITFNYPGVTLSTLTVGEDLTFVHQTFEDLG